MALVKGINSYVTLNEADSYFEDRLDAVAWTNANDELKEQALVTATSNLDQKEWLGISVSATQPLAFPRSGSFMDSSRGVRTLFSNTYSFVTTDETESTLARDIQMLRKATYELAYHLLNNEGLTDSTGTVESIKVGSIELTEIRNSSTTAKAVNSLVNPMLRNSTRYWRGW